jgi:cytochrome c oxidase subunit 4
MSSSVTSPEITFHPEHSDNTKVIWRTFWILSILTIAELSIGIGIYTIHKGENPSETLVLAFKGMVCILTLAKAYYIVSVFMHLGDELRNMIMTIIVPLCLFVWFITAFLLDGNSWRNLRNKFNKTDVNKTEQVAPAVKEKGAKD